MTTKIKIIFGFVVMIVILGVVSVIGYSALQTATDGLTDYQEISVTSVSTSDMLRTINLFIANIYRFSYTQDDSYVDQANTGLNNFDGYVSKTRALLDELVTMNLLEQVSRDSQQLRSLLSTLQQSLTQINTIHTTQMRPLINSMQNELLRLGELTFAVSNEAASSLVLQSMNALGTSYAYITRYSASKLASDAQGALDGLAQLNVSLNKIGSAATAGEERQIVTELQKISGNISTVLDEINTHNTAMNNALHQLATLTDQIRTNLLNLNDLVDAHMREVGDSTLSSNKNLQRVTMIIGIFGMVLGVALALFAIISLIRSLRYTAEFAQSIAAGHFDAQINVKEKGEIGNMVTAMKEIPHALDGILDEYKELERAIENGELDVQANASKYQGGFATLVLGTNNILTRYVTILESIPSPVLAMDRDQKARYLNAIGRELAGQNYKGKIASELVPCEDSGTPQNALRIARETKRLATAETRAHPRGMNMDISYTVIPMLNTKGEIVSFLQLVTDLTSIKETERKIINVASEAHEIANRVAAAAEQLSAQVEQVSRGTDMQRSRVDSTASAMTEMNSTVLEVARNAAQASEQSDITRNKATEGAKLVGQVVTSMTEISSVAHGMQAGMQGLGVQAESIGSVMNVIMDIADQTNLLALNAAIEAARAGEAGRGFAVVADEVRKLAEKTMSATHEVGSSITAMQDSTRTNITNMGEAVKGVTAAAEQANLSGVALKEIVNLASNNSAIVASIATAAEEQSATSDEINHAVSEINAITNETAEGMLQASAAVQELSSMAQKLRSVMEVLS